MPPIWAKVSGVWQEIEPQVKVSGTWRDAETVYAKVSGVWEEVYSAGVTTNDITISDSETNGIHIDETHIYVANFDGIDRYNARNGTYIDSDHFSGLPNKIIGIAGNSTTLYIMDRPTPSGSVSRKIFGFSKTSGNKISGGNNGDTLQSGNYNNGAMTIQGNSIYSIGALLIAGSQSLYLLRYAFNGASSSANNWNSLLASPVTGVAHDFDNGNIYVVSAAGDRTVSKFNATGSVFVEDVFDLPDGNQSPAYMEYYDGHLYIGNREGGNVDDQIYVYDIDGTYVGGG